MRKVLFLLLPLLATPALATDYYVSTNGAASSGCGSGCSGTGCCRPSLIWGSLQAGDTVYYNDGTYTGSNYMVTPTQSGTEGVYITIKALNDGSVNLDGQNSNRPIGLGGVDYNIIEGFNAYNSRWDVVALWDTSSDPGNPNPATYNILRRIVAWDARDENRSVYSIDKSHYNLLEDCAGFGVGRKIFQFHGEREDRVATGNICRRCWARWEGSTNVGPKIGISMWYNTIDLTCENCLATWDNGSMPDTYVLQNNGAVWTGTGAGTYTGGRPDQPYGPLSRDANQYITYANAKVYGSIAYIKGSTRYDPGNVVWLGGESDILIENTVAIAEPGSYDTKRPFNLYNGGDNSDLIATDLTSVGVTGDSIHQYYVQTDVEHATSVGALGDSIYVGDGAHICHRYINGVEDPDTILWPWPMNARILAATTTASAAGHQHYIYQGSPPSITLVTDPHAIADVTADIEALFGTVPDACTTAVHTGRRVIIISENFQPEDITVTPPSITVATEPMGVE